MDCICCGFGAVLLLFILTAKRQITLSEASAQQAAEAAATLEAAIEAAEAKQKALEQALEAAQPVPKTDSTSIAALAAKQERLAKAVEDRAEALRALSTPEAVEAEPAAPERPTADRNYLSGLRLRGPRAVIILEASGSMLADTAAKALAILRSGDPRSADKWHRAKTAVRTVLAGIPKGTRVAVMAMAESTTLLSGPASAPFIDPYDNTALVQLLDRLEQLEAGGGADLGRAFAALKNLPERPSSLLLVGDGLPTAPAPPGGRLSETERVDLFNRSLANRPNAPFNSILLPFEGDPSAAGLFWKLSGASGGVTLIPDESWPPR